MRTIYLSAFLLILPGCATDDARLHGTWHSDRDATVAAAFQRDPRWANVPLERVEQFKDLYGHMTLTYSNRVVTSSYRGETASFPYRVIRRGPDFVVIRTGGKPFGSGHDTRIQFVDGGDGFWSDSGRAPLSEASTLEKFDRVVAAPGDK